MMIDFMKGLRLYISAAYGHKRARPNVASSLNIHKSTTRRATVKDLPGQLYHKVAHWPLLFQQEGPILGTRYGFHDGTGMTLPITDDLA